MEAVVGGESLRRPGPFSTSRIRISLVVVTLATLFVSACAGDGPPPGVGASTTSTSLVGGGSLLGQLQQTLFTPTCALAGCHDALTQIEGLNLSSTTTSYDDLVDIASTCAGKLRVFANDVDASYLVDKVGDGAPFCGVLMPQGLPPLSSQQLQLIRDWINQGAPPASGLRFHVTTTSTSVTAPVSTTATSTSTSTVPAG